MTAADVIVIGGGMAGVSVGFELSRTHSVVVLEREEHLTYRSTGRSAAMFFQNLGAGPIRSLTVASHGFLCSPPAGHSDVPLTHPRGAMWIARPDQRGSLEEIAEGGRRAGSRVHELSPDEVAERVPVIRPDLLAGGLWEPDPVELDVAAIHQSYLRGFRMRGGLVASSAPVQSLARRGGTWHVATGKESLSADLIVNAAGAWGDQVASLAGVAPVGLQPLRRTAFMVAGDTSWAAWPFVVDADHEFYFKPDGSQLLCSPADETPCPPGDARPDPIDVAMAIERINQATTLGIRSVRSEWAGLRTFTADRAPVVGPDPDEPSFVWLVGQGGTGIQAAPATAELAAALVRGERLPLHLEEAGVVPTEFFPDRPSLARSA